MTRNRRKQKQTGTLKNGKIKRFRGNTLRNRDISLNKKTVISSRGSGLMQRLLNGLGFLRPKR